VTAGCNTSAAVIEGILEEQATTVPEALRNMRQETDSIVNVSDVASSPYLQAVLLYFASCFIISVCI
jgi:hypothetical protein